MKARRGLLAALAAAFAIRLAFAAWAWSHAPMDTSSDGYETLALSLLERGEYAMTPGRPTSFREPLYPLLIAGVYGLSGGRAPWALLVLQAALGAATAWLAWRLAAGFASETAARAAFWAYALYPQAIYYCAYFFRETVSAFLAAGLMVLSRSWPKAERSARPSVALSGTAAAGLALVNSAFLPAVALAGLLLALVAPKKERALRCALYFAPLLAGLAVWSARNYSVHGRLVPGSTHGGEEFYQALVVPPEDLGTARQGEIIAGDENYRLAGLLPEAERNADLIRAGLSWIKEHPGLYLARALEGTAKFWRLWPYPRAYNLPYPIVLLASLISDAWIIVLGFCGLWLLRARWREAAALPALLLGLTVTYGAVHAVIRYRLPLMAGMAALALAAAERLRPRLWKSLGLAALLLAASAPGRARAAEAALERAMGAELSRAMKQLKAADYPPPYFVSLTAVDSESFEQRCLLAGTSYASNSRQRLITPDVRVGSHELDNHPISPGSVFIGRGVSFEDDEFSLRHGLWRILDNFYKSASADFLRKQAVRVSRGKTEYDTDDLSKESPRVRLQEPPAASPGLDPALASVCREASRVFRRAPGLLHAEATVRERRHWSRLRDSEGSKVDFGRRTAEVELEAIDLSTDGLRLFSFRRFSAPTPEGLPPLSEIRRQAGEMLSDLAALKVAKTTSPFSAPALLDPSVSGAVMLAISSRLSGEEQRNPGGAQTFRGKMDTPVLPPDITVYDDPSAPSFKGMPLVGHYEYDDQGIAGKKVVLVEKGVLKGLLLSRYPVIGFPRSNGHAREVPGYAPDGTPSSVFLESARPRAQGELLALLREECRRRGKPYGLWVRKLRQFSQQQSAGSQGSIRIMPGLLYLVDAETGALTLVRDLDAVGTPLTLMNNVLAAGSDVEASNFVLGVPVSAVVPSLLMADLELQRAETKPEKAPILPPPPAPPSAPRVERRVPIVPTGPHIQVQRWRLKSYRGFLPSFQTEGIEEWRQRREGDDLVVEARIVGDTLSAMGANMVRAQVELERLAGKPPEKTVWSPAMTRSAYKSLHGSSWPTK